MIVAWRVTIVTLFAIVCWAALAGVFILFGLLAGAVVTVALLLSGVFAAFWGLRQGR
jgi:homoserine trans-succinylase